MAKRVILVPPADVTGLNSPRCDVCEYPRDHRCRCGALLCITKHCTGKWALGQHDCARPPGVAPS